MSEMDAEALEALAKQAKGYLRWAVFLLGVMAVILVLDVQLARSVKNQAVAASKLIGQRVFEAEAGRDRGASPDVAATPDDGGQPGRGSGDAVDGVPGVAEGTSQTRGAKQTRGRGVAQRPPGDGPGADR